MTIPIGDTSAGKAAPALAAVKAEESPPPAPPTRLKIESEDQGRVRGQKGHRQPSLFFMFELELHHELKRGGGGEPDPPKPPNIKKAATGKRKQQATGEGGGKAAQGGVKREKEVQSIGTGEWKLQVGEGKERGKGQPQAHRCAYRTHNRWERGRWSGP